MIEIVILIYKFGLFGNFLKSGRFSGAKTLLEGLKTCRADTQPRRLPCSLTLNELVPSRLWRFRFCRTFAGQPPAFILSRGLGFPGTKVQRLLKTKDVSAGDWLIGVGPRASRKSAADRCMTRAMEMVQRAVVPAIRAGRSRWTNVRLSINPSDWLWTNRSRSLRDQTAADLAGQRRRCKKPGQIGTRREPRYGLTVKAYLLTSISARTYRIDNLRSAYP